MNTQKITFLHRFHSRGCALFEVRDISASPTFYFPFGERRTPVEEAHTPKQNNNNNKLTHSYSNIISMNICRVKFQFVSLYMSSSFERSSFVLGKSLINNSKRRRPIDQSSRKIEKLKHKKNLKFKFKTIKFKHQTTTNNEFHRHDAKFFLVCSTCFFYPLEFHYL